MNITVEEWNAMSEQQQEEYIEQNNTQIAYTHDISDTLQKGWGNLSDNGFWEFTCKSIKNEQLWSLSNNI